MLASLTVCIALAASAEAPGPVVANFDHRAYGRAYSEITRALHAEDFSQLDRLHAQFAAGPARTKDGTWMMQAFQEVFETHFAMLPPATIERFFAKWKSVDAQSTLRPIAEALAWQQRAWSARSSACRQVANEPSRKAYQALLARAAAALRDARLEGRDSALGHTAALLLAGGQGLPPAQLDALLDDSIARFPAYQPLYAARMQFLLPEWGGDFEQVDRFIRNVSERTRVSEGRSFYAWLYLDLARSFGCPQHFEASRVSWPEMSAAFEDMLQRHPDVWNRNVYATFACRARDVATTLRLFAELGSQANLGAWSPGVSNESCRRLIRSTPETVKAA